MIYTFSTWLFFFYFYCFLGWVWETCYVSVLKAKWVNRGFMRGPFLPIYGSGAIVVLIFTLPFRTNAGLVFLVGMTSATLLEYFTGVVMEKMFHVRYWDYSSQRLCLQGIHVPQHQIRRPSYPGQVREPPVCCNAQIFLLHCQPSLKQLRVTHTRPDDNTLSHTPSHPLLSLSFYHIEKVRQSQALANFCSKSFYPVSETLEYIGLFL